jgi:hypothetical protein
MTSSNSQAARDRRAPLAALGALAAAVGIAGALATDLSVAQVPVYTAANPPATPALTSLPLVPSLTKDGVTWTFSEPVRAGQFVTGDYYVVGPVTVTAISPAPTAGRNGSVVNLPGCRPPNTDQTGFDDRTQAGRYNAALRASVPIQLNPGDALTSSISVATIGTIKQVMRPEQATISPVRTVSVLTSVNAPLPPDTFRPSYCGRQSEFFYSRNLRRSLLPRLAPVTGTPSLAQFAAYLRRPWIDTLYFGFDAPVEYMPDYGREVARVAGNAGLLLTLNFPEADREALLVYMVQRGIDLFGVVSAGHPGWHPHGGHGSGRKLPIVFAGMMLGDSRMHDPPANFGEDMHTIIASAPPYGPGFSGATALFTGHMGLTGESVKAGWGPYEHKQPRDWLASTGEEYRRCCTSIAFVGQALAAKLIGAQTYWNHPAFFAYVNRWMNQDDTQDLATIKTQTGQDYSASWMRHGQSWDTFVDNMWRAYSNYSGGGILPAPTNLRIVSP